MAEMWTWIAGFFSQIFNFTLPWGVSFGSLVVAVFGIPLLVLALKKFL